MADSVITTVRQKRWIEYKKLLIICEVLESNVARVAGNVGGITQDRERRVMDAIRHALKSNMRQTDLPPRESYHLTMIQGGKVYSISDETDMPIQHQNSRLFQTRIEQRIIDTCRRIHASLRKNHLRLKITCTTQRGQDS